MSAAEIVPFVYDDDRTVRTVAIADETWFVVSDVCRIVDIREPSGPLSRVDHRDRRRLRRSDTPELFGGIAAQVQEINVVNESGLYDLIIESRKPEARKFRRWVTNEVIPSIRRTGAHTVERRDVDPLDHLQGMLDQLRENRDTATRAELTAVRAETKADDTGARLDAIEGKHGWFAALAYARRRGLPTDTTRLKRLGAAAGRIGREHDLEPGRVEHALYGWANSWPEWVWDEASQRTGIASDS